MCIFVLQGEFEEAKSCYTQACCSEWQQFHHFCYWELIWCHQLSRDWWPAIDYSDKLFKESRWSKTFYAYLKAAQMCMVQDDLSREQRKVQEELMCDLPNWKQRIAGKSIPMEKFAILKARRFLDQKNKLVLPVLELIYLWNGFKLIGNSYKSVEPFYNMVEKAFVEHNKGKCYT